MPQNKLILYIAIMLMAVFMLGCLTSLGFIKKEIEGATVDLKVGELEYTIECGDLTNNQITLSPNSNKILEIKLMSNNAIDSRYEFFYKIISPKDTEGITGGYLVSSTDLPMGEIKSNEEKNIKVILFNTTSEDITIEINLKAGLVHNELVLNESENTLTEEISTTTITYVTDTNTSYQEQITIGESILSPTTFAPEKSGWTFLGWKEDTSADASVLTSKTASEEMTLYAVYTQEIIATFKSYGSTQAVKGNRYYNAYGNIANASVTVPSGASYTGWTFIGWSAAETTTANASVSYANGSTITEITTAATYYGLYSKSVTLSYSGNGNTGGSTASESKTVYYNAYGNTLDATFTLKSNGFTKTNHTFSKWAIGSTSGTKYSAGASVTLTSSTIFYAIWTVNSVYYTAAQNGYFSNQYDATIPLKLSAQTSGQSLFTLSSNQITVNATCTVKFEISFKDEAHSSDTNHSHAYTFYVKRVRSGATANVISKSYTAGYNQTSRTISQSISASSGDKYYLYVYTGGDTGTTISSLTVKVTSS